MPGMISQPMALTPQSSQQIGRCKAMGMLLILMPSSPFNSKLMPLSRAMCSISAACRSQMAQTFLPGDPALGRGIISCRKLSNSVEQLQHFLIYDTADHGHCYLHKLQYLHIYVLSWHARSQDVMLMTMGIADLEVVKRSGSHQQLLELLGMVMQASLTTCPMQLQRQCKHPRLMPLASYLVDCPSLSASSTIIL